jgi:hypothetical protein
VLFVEADPAWLFLAFIGFPLAWFHPPPVEITDKIGFVPQNFYAPPSDTTFSDKRTSRAILEQKKNFVKAPDKATDEPASP